MSTESFDADGFIALQTEEIRRNLGAERAIIAVSGGVDSTTCAALTRKAVNDNLVCVFIDTGFMRKGEPETVKQNLARPPLKLPLKIVRAQKYFMKNLQGLFEAEEKRKSFRESFYSTLANVATRESCRWLVQGTIAPDLIETKGGVKTQHNVLEQIGIDPEEKYGLKVIEPLASLYKPQVRVLSRRLGFLEETSERQPFPGPGLMVRCVGAVSTRKMNSLKIATSIVEKELKDLGAQQYFAAVVEDYPQEGAEAERLANSISGTLRLQRYLFKTQILNNSATGVSGAQRVYGRIAAISLSPAGKKEAEMILEKATASCKDLITANVEYTRLLLEIGKSARQKTCAAIVRAVRTEDFMTAGIVPIPWRILTRISSKIIRNCGSISSVYYDLTPKPPATIEFE
jgi:GMP synthase (glutamine-hydrolysing)